jgi:hypothetical protein
MPQIPQPNAPRGSQETPGMAGPRGPGGPGGMITPDSFGPPGTTVAPDVMNRLMSQMRPPSPPARESAPGQPSMIPPMMMRMMFSLMDSDSDGTVSLQEFQAAHERIFKAMDSNRDGKLTLEEMQSFMR